MIDYYKYIVNFGICIPKNRTDVPIYLARGRETDTHECNNMRDRVKCNLQPLSLKEAQLFVDKHHRHNVAPQGHKFSIGLSDGVNVIGVVIIGRPVARHNQDGWTLEVVRCCVLDGYKDACSKLYASAWRATRAMGYNRLITYTLKSEPGTSLRAAGWKVIGETQARKNGWNTPSRPRVMAERYPVGQKTLWEIN